MFSLRVKVRGITYSQEVTQISLYKAKCFIPSGRVFVTIIAREAFTKVLSSLSFSTQESLQAFVFFDSQTIIHEFCQNLFFTI
jgi:hypothetical protein